MERVLALTPTLLEGHTPHARVVHIARRSRNSPPGSILQSWDWGLGQGHGCTFREGHM